MASNSSITQWIPLSTRVAGVPALWLAHGDSITLAIYAAIYICLSIANYKPFKLLTIACVYRILGSPRQEARDRATRVVYYPSSPDPTLQPDAGVRGD